MNQLDDMPTILIAHSERDARETLARELDADGYHVLDANTPSNTAQLLAQEPVVLLLGPLGSPGHAPELLRELRAGALACPAILPVLTIGAADTITTLRAYEAGSDHHLPAGTSYVLLRSILAAVVRRCTMRELPSDVIEVGPLIVDVARREVRVHDELVELSKREFELLRTLASDPTRVFTKQQLLEDLWGHVEGSPTRTLDSHACRLRRRLTADGDRFIVNRWGVGYALLED